MLIPRPVLEICSPRLLVMERMPGMPMTQVLARLAAAGPDLKDRVQDLLQKQQEAAAAVAAAPAPPAAAQGKPRAPKRFWSRRQVPRVDLTAVASSAPASTAAAAAPTLDPEDPAMLYCTVRAAMPELLRAFGRMLVRDGLVRPREMDAPFGSGHGPPLLGFSTHFVLLGVGSLRPACGVGEYPS